MHVKHIALWLAVPLVILVGANMGVAKIGHQRETWYPQVIRDKTYQEVQVIVLGSSRVGAAVDVTKSKVPMLNLGRGYSTTAEHYLGLKRMVQADPTSLKGKWVLVEATGGLPEHISYRGGAWFDLGNPSLMTKVIAPEDLSDLWQCNAPSELKWEVTLRMAANKIALFKYKELIQGLLVSNGSELTESLTWEHQQNTNLSSAAGIRVDEVSQAAARKLALSYLDQQRRDVKPLRDWDDTCVGKMIDLVRSSGGSIGFFETPLHSAFSSFYAEDTMRQNIEGFAAYAEKNGVPILRPAVRFPDSSFPDVWHLAKSDSEAYTWALNVEIEKNRSR